MSAPECSVDECPNDAARRGLCWAHWKQDAKTGRTQQLIEKGKGRWAAVQRAALQYAEDTEAVPGEDPMAAFRRADQRLRKSLYRYMEPLWKRRAAQLERLIRETFQ